MQFRIDISVRQRGCTPCDWRELKSENFNDYEEYAEAVKQCVLDNIYDQLEGADEDD